MNDRPWRQFLTRQGAHWDERGVIHFSENAFLSLPAENAVLADLSHWSALRVAGPEARKFLQGQVTCDMAAINPSQWRRGACCDVKGRALFNFYCCQLPTTVQGTFVLVLPRSTAELAQAQLKKYAVFSKVQIELMDDNRCFGLLSGRQQAEQLTQQRFTGGNNVAHEDSVSIIELPGERYFLITSNDSAQRYWQSLANTCEPAGYRAWDLAAIRAGHADVEAATSGEFIPQLLNFHLTDGISFTKGCYLGQEVVARMNYRGTLKRHLRRAKIDMADLPSLNTPLFGVEGKQTIGNIVSAAQTDPDSIEVLAVVTDNAFDANQVYLDRQKQDKLHFLPLPYAITK